MKRPVDHGARPPARSPLYTSPAAVLAKLQFISDFGKDSDGAYRTRNRKDGLI